MRAAAIIAAVLLCAGCATARGPLIDYDCADKCVKKDGIAPVCVDDGRDVNTGTIFPNNCIWNTCVTYGGSESTTPRYNYLPLNCGSAVACSLMGKDYEKCLKTWAEVNQDGYTGPSPKTDPMCECATKAKAAKCESGAGNCARCNADKSKCQACKPAFRITSGGKCEKCLIKGCKVCQNSKNKCQRCYNSLRMKNGVCVEK